MPNRLAGETSPYLLQHADNPVDWFPWGTQALELARQQDKPILLSIGYSACHWCHVMAHESFEDPIIAAKMNELFVNIKVDREERPDLDQIYQSAHQMLMRQRGGWPLTVFLSPDGVPFHTGTYFPPQAGHGRPAFGDLLDSVDRAWREQRAAIATQNARMLQGFALTLPTPSEQTHVTAATQDAAFERLNASFDVEHGGFSGAPKFPHPTDLAWLLSRSGPSASADELSPDQAQARHMALHSLTCMASGGLYDQLGGGFCRYSVDARWEIPHFEKMLYDNGPLLGVYADALSLTEDPLFERVVEDTANWVIRDMQAEATDTDPNSGGYCSSLDADSEGEEGRYYVWQAEQVRTSLIPPEWDLAAAHWGLIDPANFEGKAWHLRIARPTAALAKTLQQSHNQVEALISSARIKLLAAREKRERPGRDDKILTSWNALMISGMARAALVCNRRDWLDSARRAADFIHGSLWRGGRLLATYKDGRAHLDAYLDDHAYLIEALLALTQADFDLDDLNFARELADCLLSQFEDPEHGGFFFTRHDHEALIHRPKHAHDGATPSGNGTAAFALQRLGHVLGEPRYLDAAARTLALFAAEASENPQAHARLLMAAAEQATPPTLVVLRGGQAELWRDQLLSAYQPHTLVLAVPDGLGADRGLPAVLNKPEPPRGQTQAWVCQGHTCLAPVQQWDELLTTLQAASAGYAENS